MTEPVERSALENAIGDVASRLREGQFPNEQAVSQAIVLRVLRELGWDTNDPTAVWPEFQTGEGRADFALCHPPSKPAGFIEVKAPGKAEDGVRQALEYAFHTGVPFIILTDGRIWSFYLPVERGSYEERRVYKLDLLERTVREAAETLQRYLTRERIASGAAMKAAKEDHESRSRRAQAQVAIPAVWRELVTKGNEELVALVADAVESKAGVRPDDDVVAEFLATMGGQVGPVVLAAPRQPAPEAAPKRTSTASVSGDAPRRGQLEIKGKSYSYNNAQTAMAIVLRQLAKGDPTFLARCAQHPDAQGKKRRYIARSVEELYPGKPNLHGCCEKLPGGWLVATNLNNPLKMTIIRLATQIAGLSFGRDVVVQL